MLSPFTLAAALLGIAATPASTPTFFKPIVAIREVAPDENYVQLNCKGCCQDMLIREGLS
jgi:hypothetical protein